MVVNDAPMRSVPTSPQRRHSQEGRVAPVPSRWMPSTTSSDSSLLRGPLEQADAAPITVGVDAEKKCHR